MSYTVIVVIDFVMFDLQSIELRRSKPVALETKKHPKVLFGGTSPAGALTHAVLFQLLTQRAAVDAHQVGGAGLVTASIFHHFFEQWTLKL